MEDYTNAVREVHSAGLCVSRSFGSLVRRSLRSLVRRFRTCGRVCGVRGGRGGRASFYICATSCRSPSRRYRDSRVPPMNMPVALVSLCIQVTRDTRRAGILSSPSTRFYTARPHSIYPGSGGNNTRRRRPTSSGQPL